MSFFGPNKTFRYVELIYDQINTTQFIYNSRTLTYRPTGFIVYGLKVLGLSTLSTRISPQTSEQIQASIPYKPTHN